LAGITKPLGVTPVRYDLLWLQHEKIVFILLQKGFEGRKEIIIKPGIFCSVILKILLNIYFIFFELNLLAIPYFEGGRAAKLLHGAASTHWVINIPTWPGAKTMLRELTQSYVVAFASKI
jgi:hypothetical protein